MQQAKPSFLEYFELKEKEANSHNEGGGRGENNADNRKLPGEGDLEVVSRYCVCVCVWLMFSVLRFYYISDLISGN